MKYIAILIAITLIFISFFRYLKSYKYTKDCQGVIRIRNSKILTIITLCLGIFEFFTNLNWQGSSSANFQTLLTPLSESLPWFISSLAYFDYNFITSNGVIINGKMFSWIEIKKWNYKKDFFNVIVFHIIPKKDKNYGGSNSLETVEMKISNKSIDEVEGLLRQYLGEKTCDPFYVDSL